MEPIRSNGLIATGRVLRRGREISTGEVTVYDTEDTEIAVALVTYRLSAPA
jgi:acyl-coenzyme A thioesterase PaaI-like protein